MALEEHQHVTLSVTDEIELPTEGASAQSCFELARSLGLIGVATDLPVDLSTNKAHFEGLGCE